MSTIAISTATGPHGMTKHQATAELCGVGWKRLIEALNSSDTNTIFDPVTVQCLLQYFVLGSSCREFNALFRASSA
jgi:hypothetical protein